MLAFNKEMFSDVINLRHSSMHLEMYVEVSMECLEILHKDFSIGIHTNYFDEGQADCIIA